MKINLDGSVLLIELDDRETDVLNRTRENSTLQSLEELIDTYVNNRARNLERLEVTKELRMRKQNARRS